MLVIGGGPAGSTAAALLAEQGFRVVLLEKDRHPRFHIGESLLPCTRPLFERLGVLEEIERIGIRKYGAQVNARCGQRKLTIYFDQALDPVCEYAYQVRRSEFDAVLFKRCAALGTDVHEETRVQRVHLGLGASDSVVVATDRSGTERCWQARFIIDASGRDTLLADQLGIKRRNRKHASAAIFGHFQGAERLPGRDEGNISIHWFEHGWLWMIPLKDGAMSVGAVCRPDYLRSRRSTPEAFFLATIHLCPAVAWRLRGARLTSAVTATGNYSYAAEHMAGPGYVLIGDAYAFVDPIFSSGVHLAMHSAALGVEVAGAFLRGDHRPRHSLAALEGGVRSGLRQFSWFIYRAASPALQRLLFVPRNYLHMRDALVSILSGDVYRRGKLVLPVSLFKCVYYLSCLFDVRRSWHAYRLRRSALRTVP
ncbi:MAG: NAD(P)/FAD-dependent oxidoreductase, partial [Terriglobales bacterium]